MKTPTPQKSHLSSSALLAVSPQHNSSQDFSISFSGPQSFRCLRCACAVQTFLTLCGWCGAIARASCDGSIRKGMSLPVHTTLIHSALQTLHGSAVTEDTSSTKPVLLPYCKRAHAAVSFPLKISARGSVTEEHGERMGTGDPHKLQGGGFLALHGAWSTHGTARQLDQRSQAPNNHKAGILVKLPLFDVGKPRRLESRWNRIFFYTACCLSVVFAGIATAAKTSASLRKAFSLRADELSLRSAPRWRYQERSLEQVVLRFKVEIVKVVQFTQKQEV